MAQFAAFFGDSVDDKADKGLGDHFETNLAEYREVHDMRRRIRGFNMTDWRWLESCLRACHRIYRSLQPPPAAWLSKDCAELLPLMLAHRYLSNETAASRVLEEMMKSGLYSHLALPGNERKKLQMVANIRVKISRMRNTRTATAPTGKLIELLSFLEPVLDLPQGTFVDARDILRIKARLQHQTSLAKSAPDDTQQSLRDIAIVDHPRSLPERVWPVKLQQQVTELLADVERQHGGTNETPQLQPATAELRKQYLGRLFAIMHFIYKVPIADLTLELIVNVLFWESALEHERRLAPNQCENSSVVHFQCLAAMIFCDQDCWLFRQNQALQNPLLSLLAKEHCFAADICQTSEPARAWITLVSEASCRINGAITGAVLRSEKRPHHDYNNARALVANVVDFPSREIIPGYLLTKLRDRRVPWCDEQSVKCSFDYSLMLLAIIYRLSSVELARIAVTPTSLYLHPNESITLKVRGRSGILKHSYVFWPGGVTGQFDPYEALFHSLELRERFLKRKKRKPTQVFFVQLLDTCGCFPAATARPRLLRRRCQKIADEIMPGVFPRPLSIPGWSMIAECILTAALDENVSISADISATAAHSKAANLLQSALF